MIIVGKRPRNETRTHFLLKQVGKYVLTGMGYRIVGTEVGGLYGAPYSSHTKNIVDVVGCKVSSSGAVSLCAIEAKASLSDFRNGFCRACALTYVIAPKGIIPLSEIPSGVGLIEVDMKALKVFAHALRPADRFEGVSTTKRATKTLNQRFQDQSSYDAWCKSMLPRIAYRTSVELLYNRSSLKFSGRSRRR